MKKGLKIALIGVGSFLGLFAIDLTVSLIYVKTNETTTTHELKKSFSNIKFDVSTSDIEFIKVDKGYGKVVCKESKKLKHTVKVEENTLKINFDHKYRFNFLMFQPNYRVQVYIPATNEYDLHAISSTGDISVGNSFTFSNIKLEGSTGDVDFSGKVKNKVDIKASTGRVFISKMKPTSIIIETSTGSTHLKDINCSGNINLESSTGDNYLTDVKAKNLFIKASTGDTRVDNVILSGKLTVHVSTGKVRIVESDAAEIYIKTSTGDVDADFLTSKIVYAKTNTGDVDVPKSTSGGLCTIETSTGDIKVTFKK